MSNVHVAWVPKKRNVVYKPRPDGIPPWVYTEAMVAKKFYNEDWEFWVWQIAKDYNVSQAEAEDACIRGIKKEILKMYTIYGDTIGRWYEDFLGFEDLFRMVKLPEFEKKLDIPIVEKTDG